MIIRFTKLQMNSDLAKIKENSISDGELTDWAKHELAEARKIPESECSQNPR